MCLLLQHVRAAARANRLANERLHRAIEGLAAEAFHAPLLTAESLAVDWVHVERIHDLPLHPGFAASWEKVREIA